MNVEAVTNLTAIVISDAPGLDPITAIFQNFSPGQGRLIVQCYDKAWTCYWGGMSGKTVQEFIDDNDPGYYVNCLVSHNQPQKQRREEVAYVTRIVAAIQFALVHSS